MDDFNFFFLHQNALDTVKHILPQEWSHAAESSSGRPWIKLNSPAGLSAEMSDRDAEVCVLLPYWSHLFMIYRTRS